MKIEWAAEDEAPPPVATPETPAGDGQAGAADAPKDDKPRTIPVAMVPTPTADEVPSWALWPEGLRAPRHRVVYFMRFASNWTDAPGVGVDQGLTEEEAASWKQQGVPVPEKWRQAIVWGLSIGDQKNALGRANGDPNRFNAELAKQMIRAIDGMVVDRSGMGSSQTGNLDLWWEQIGERCRAEMTRLCNRIHSLTPAERALFFGHCVAARTAG